MFGPQHGTPAMPNMQAAQPAPVKIQHNMNMDQKAPAEVPKEKPKEDFDDLFNL